MDDRTLSSAAGRAALTLPIKSAVGLGEEVADGLPRAIQQVRADEPRNRIGGSNVDRGLDGVDERRGDPGE